MGKSISSRIYTLIYQQCHKKHGHITLKLTCLMVLILYCIASIWLDVPYWIGHGIVYHFDHFKWTSSLNGSYCDNEKWPWTNAYLQTLSSESRDFEQTRSRILLLSYPRSGNHLTKAMIECLLEKPTYGYAKEKNNEKEQEVAIKNASTANPYIRKIHHPSHIFHIPHIYNYSQWGLIYLIRDPVECILSEFKYVPHFWKDYEHEFETHFLRLPTFYNEYGSDTSKLIIFYEDYFNGSHAINLRKLAQFFGPNRVSNERLNYCIDHYHQITKSGLKSLDRGATSNANLHFYRSKYYGKNSKDWPEISVPSDLYQSIF